MGKQQGTKLSLAGRRPYWTAEEDAQLMRLVRKYGTKNWGIIAKELRSPIPRKGKSCRSRWMHQLNPLIKHEPFSVEEERILIAKQREYGNKWSKIATFLPGRTDNAIKNHWHGHVKRRISSRFSSDEDDVMDVEIKEDGWNEMEVYPVPCLKGIMPGTVQQDMECAMTLLDMHHAQTNNTIPDGANGQTVQSGYTEKPDNENVYRVAWPPFVKREVPSEVSEVCMDTGGGPSDNAASLIRPDQQVILSQTLESAGLGHCSVLPLCPIKEEDIDSNRHVVIVLQNEEEKTIQDSSSEGQSVCLLPDDRSIQEWTPPSGPLTVLESLRQSVYDGYPQMSSNGRSLSPPRPRREIKKPTKFLAIQQKLDR